MYNIRLQLAKITGRFVGNFSRRLKLGSGSVIGGRIALLVDDQLISKSRNLFTKGIIFITGTNGKSTTTYYIASVLRSLGYTVATNRSGANMRTGVATTCLETRQPVDYGVFEVDEASVARLTNELQPSHLICLNFSRDQLDRYAEIEFVRSKIVAAANANQTTVLYNYGNPHSATLGYQASEGYGYMVEVTDRHPCIDIPTCPGCSIGLLTYTEALLNCSHCDFVACAPALVSNYHEGLLRIMDKAVGASSPELADTLTACALLLQRLGLSSEKIIPALERTPPLPVHRVQFAGGELLLGKNPESFHRLLNQVLLKKPARLIFVINDNPADGLDTSWLWDIDVQRLRPMKLSVYVTGSAATDIALRLQAAGITAEVIDETELCAFCSRYTNTMVLANYTAYRQVEALLQQSTAATTTAHAPDAVPTTEYEYL